MCIYIQFYYTAPTLRGSISACRCDATLQQRLHSSVHSLFLLCVLVGLASLPALVSSASVETRSPVAQAGVMQRFDSDCTAVFIHCFCCACWCCDMRFILYLSYYMLGLIAGVSNYAKNKSSCCVYPGLHFYVQRRVQMYAK